MLLEWQSDPTWGLVVRKEARRFQQMSDSSASRLWNIEFEIMDMFTNKRYAQLVLYMKKRKTHVHVTRRNFKSQNLKMPFALNAQTRRLQSVLVYRAKGTYICWRQEQATPPMCLVSHANGAYIFLRRALTAPTHCFGVKSTRYLHVALRPQRKNP